MASVAAVVTAGGRSVWRRCRYAVCGKRYACASVGSAGERARAPRLWANGWWRGRDGRIGGRRPISSAPLLPPKEDVVVCPAGKRPDTPPSPPPSRPPARRHVSVHGCARPLVHYTAVLISIVLYAHALARTVDAHTHARTRTYTHIQSRSWTLCPTKRRGYAYAVTSGSLRLASGTRPARSCDA